MKKAFRIVPWIILAVPLLGSAFFYGSIGNDVLIARSLFGGENIFAPKSLFTVFRVPLIEIICAAAIETIRPKTPDPNSFSLWNVLLYTIAFKSLLQFFEFVSTSVFSAPAKADFFFYATAVVVAAGIFLASIRGWKIFFVSARKDWTLSTGKKLFLVFLLVSYLFFAFGSDIDFKHP